MMRNNKNNNKDLVNQTEIFWFDVFLLESGTNENYWNFDNSIFLFYIFYLYISQYSGTSL